MNFSNTSPSHGLQLFTNCPSVGPSPGVQSFRNRLLQRGSPRGHKPCQQTCSGVGSSLSMGPQVLAGTCSSTGSPRGHSFLQAPTCFGMGSLPRAAGGDLLHHGPPWAAGNNLPHHGLHHKLQRKALCSDILGTSSPSFFTDLGVCRVVSLTSSHFSR